MCATFYVFINFEPGRRPILDFIPLFRFIASRLPTAVFEFLDNQHVIRMHRHHWRKRFARQA